MDTNSISRLPTGSERDAGAIALQIADIASRTQPKTALARKLACLVRGELGADACAFFWRQQADRPSRGERAPIVRLRMLAAEVSTAQPEPCPEIEHSMRVTAYRSLSKHEVIDRQLRGSAPYPSGQLVALPLGSPHPWIICTVWWAQDSLPTARALLERLEASLTAATLPAHLLDLSRRAEYEQAERRAIFAATSEAILSIGSDSIITESNPAFVRMMAWQDRSPVNRRCSEVLRCRDSHKTLLCDSPQCPLQQVLFGETPLAVQELYWETSTGDLRDVSASFTPHRLRDTQLAVVVARDDTTLNVANRMKASFISMVSHELRTPLNSINGFIEIVADEQVGPLNPRQQEFLGYVRTSALQLSALVEDVLLITKADSGQFSLRPTEIDAESLLRQAMQSVTGAATQAEVTMTLKVDEEMPPLRGDELRLQQVITNLLNNAIKFSPAHETITISVRRTGRQAEFSIEDRGPGVAAEEHARIFERFYQSESGQRARSGGYGLGLAIARLIVEQHGGRIWIESNPGEGATFYVTLPLADGEAGASADVS